LRLLNERLSDFCRNEQIPLARIDLTVDDERRPLLMADGVHLTVHGHGYVTQRLLAADVGGWITEHVAVVS
jgi:hypothetical protein